MGIQRLCNRLALWGSLVFLMGCAATGMRGEPSSWARRTLRRLTLREKIAQMMIYHTNLYYRNDQDPHWQELIDLVQTDGIGAIHVYFGDVGTSLTRLNELQRLSKVPILLDADIEYGLGARFPGSTPLPPLMALAATGDPHWAYEAGRIAGEEGRAVGIRWNFSPVVDVNNNPDNPIINTRSFGDNPELVSTFGKAFMDGMHAAGMLATAKHFPGHGDTRTDSHRALAEIPSDSTRLWSLELAPFRALIDAGVDAVMVAHVHAPDYQPEADVPATLSSFWITDILKQRLGFRGAVVTDAMGMGGITTRYSDAYALVAAINAGCDIIIQNHHIRESIDVVERAVREGRIPAARIDEAALKMLELKAKAGLNRERLVDPDYTRVHFGSPEHRRLAEDMAARSVTLVRNDGPFLPLDPDDRDSVYVIDIYSRPFAHSQSVFSRRLAAAGLPVIPRAVDETDGDTYLRGLLDEIPENGRVILTSFSIPRAWRGAIYLTPRQTRFVQAVARKTSRILLVSFGNPYLIRSFPEIPNYLVNYKDQPLLQTAAARAVLGQAPIGGKLPVAIPGIAPSGSGLELEARPWPEPSPPARASRLIRVLPEEMGLDVSPLDEVLREAVADSAFPGGVVLAARHGNIFLHRGFGTHTYAGHTPTRIGHIFDLASLTKVIATTPAVMKLVEAGKLNLDDPVTKYLPDFGGSTPDQTELKERITIRHLLTHSAGFPPFRPFYRMPGTPAARMDSVLHTDLMVPPGDSTIYSDIGMITLGRIVEHITGQSLDRFTADSIFTPLGMASTGFNPPAGRLHRIVPTEYSETEGGFIHGHVHDENAYSLGGVAGHAGLFSTAYDLARFAQMMLNGGELDGVRIFQPETIDLFTRRAEVVPGSSRCLGWDSPEGWASGGVYLSDRSYGHTGFTGTSLWIDPENDCFVILLTNAVHPYRAYKNPDYYDWRQKIHSTVYEIMGFTEPNPHLQWRPRWATEEK
ncbi:MAG: beta-N-acetylglucosaminidase [Candidatus Neomarinimicrobiota bacterium]|nr:MAG: beta-N-acetylglucosaminidase [Candidatus Neomarinimicrobiota bacterium]